MSTRQSAHRPRVHNLESDKQKHLILRPVQTWEREWVIPKNDDGSNSTVKIFKWVKSEKSQNFDSDSENSNDEEIMTLTPGMDTPDMMIITTPQTPLTIPNSNSNTPLPETNAISTPGPESVELRNDDVDDEDIEHIEDIEVKEDDKIGKPDPSSILHTPITELITESITEPTPLTTTGNVLTIAPEDAIESFSLPVMK